MPPLLLDDDEAVAVAIGLRTATQRRGDRHRGDVAPGAGEARAGAPAAAPTPGEHPPGGDGPGPARAAGPDGGPGDAHRDRPPRPRALHAPLRLLGPAAGRRRSGGSSRTGSSTPASAGTSSRGTSTARTGARSASTACARGCRRVRGSRPRELTDEEVEALVARGVPVEARQHQARVLVHAPAARARRAVRALARHGHPDRRHQLHDPRRRRHPGEARGLARPARRRLLGHEPPELVAAVQALSGH